ncbi:MAG: AraC family transcriptional regulator [Pedobacter sp.]|nr:MAG: AraC family transcriptional regulator [Pedobacter sp.]
MIKRIKTISDFHRLRNLPPPEHPLISVVDVSTIRQLHPDEPTKWQVDLYIIALKRIVDQRKLIYGQSQYDFNEGLMSFIAPHQVFSIVPDLTGELQQSGWVLLIHPDFLWHTSLAKTIQLYEYFTYQVDEALFLSPKEETIMDRIAETIQQEYQATLDGFSQTIIVAHLETLLSYADRFYHRQFLTRKKTNHLILARFDELVTAYFADNEAASSGLPSVHYVSEHLNISISYLSRLLKTLTGQTTQQHIHNKLIEKAKEKLSLTDLSVSAIAYQLGFEHSQSFSKLFKSKTKQSPLEFRQHFN